MRAAELGEPSGSDEADAERALSLALAIRNAGLELRRAQTTEELILGLQPAWRGEFPVLFHYSVGTAPQRVAALNLPRFLRRTSP